MQQYFNPRAPCGRDVPVPHSVLFIDISIHAPRAGATHGEAVKLLWNQFQSTRPVRARLGVEENAIEFCNFNPRAPCGRDLPSGNRAKNQKAFQSTRPVRARPRRTLPGHTSFYFNPRAPCGRDMNSSKIIRSTSISIHAPRAGATEAYQQKHQYYVISIHAPRAGATAKVYKIILHTFATKGNF